MRLLLASPSAHTHIYPYMSRAASHQVRMCVCVCACEEKTIQADPSQDSDCCRLFLLFFHGDRAIDRKGGSRFVDWIYKPGLVLFCLLCVGRWRSSLALRISIYVDTCVPHKSLHQENDE